MTGSEGVDAENSEVVINGGQVEVSCDDFTLYKLENVNQTAEQTTPVTLNCTETEWDESENTWQCVPICLLKGQNT
jgi:hypothetical protein